MMAEPIYIPIPAGVDPENYEQLHSRAQEYLTGLGFDLQVTGVSDRYGIRIELANPADEQAVRDAVDNYTPAPSPKEVKMDQALADAKPLIKAIWNKAPGDRTNVEKVILGLAVEVYKDKVQDF
jgi:hypothetical protein